jgi:hypothetical protein
MIGMIDEKIGITNPNPEASKTDCQEIGHAIYT